MACLVLQIALHDDVAAEHDLADRLAVGGCLPHGLRVHHGQALQRGIAHALPRLLAPARAPPVEAIPFAMPFVDDRRPVGLGQPVEMGHGEAGIGHAGEHGFRRRRGGGVEGHGLRKLALVGFAWR